MEESDRDVICDIIPEWKWGGGLKKIRKTSRGTVGVMATFG